MSDTYFNTYWNNKGKYQEDYRFYSNLLIPPFDKADTLHGELLRCISNIYYEVLNNGACNMFHTWDGDYELYIEKHYKKLFDFIESQLGSTYSLLEACKDVYNDGPWSSFHKVAEPMIDKVMEIVIEEEKKREKLQWSKPKLETASSGSSKEDTKSEAAKETC